MQYINTIVYTIIDIQYIVQRLAHLLKLLYAVSNLGFAVARLELLYAKWPNMFRHNGNRNEQLIIPDEGTKFNAIE